MGLTIKAVAVAVVQVAAGGGGVQATDLQGPRVDTVYMFKGTQGAMAYTVDQTGRNLPKRYGPWRFLKPILTKGSTFQAGADKAALAEVEAKGFSVSVYTITFEPTFTNSER